MPRKPRSINPKRSKIATLSKKVNKNTRILASREIGRFLTVMDPTPDTTAVIQNLSGIAQGNDVGDRHGRKLHAESVSVSGSLNKLGVSALTKVRLFIFRDNSGTTTPPVLTDLFTDINDFFDNNHRINSEQNMKRFTILWDKHILLNEGFDGQLTGKSFKFFKKLNHDILYSGTSSTNEGQGSIWYMSASNEASNVPALTGDIVFKYSDL